MWLDDGPTATPAAPRPLAALERPALAASPAGTLLFAHGGRLCGEPQRRVLVYGLGSRHWNWCGPAAAAAGSRSSCGGAEGPARTLHCAAVLGDAAAPVLIVHGGKDRGGIVRSEAFAFHPRQRRWECLDDVLGGCAPPAMFGHAVAAMAAVGAICVVGPAADPDRDAATSGERKRPRRWDSAAEAAAAKGARDGMKMYVLSLLAGSSGSGSGATQGWREVRVASPAGLPRCPQRRHFALAAADDGAFVALAGGACGAQHLSDAWLYAASVAAWRELRLPSDAVPLRGISCLLFTATAAAAADAAAPGEGAHEAVDADPGRRAPQRALWLVTARAAVRLDVGTLAAAAPTVPLLGLAPPQSLAFVCQAPAAEAGDEASAEGNTDGGSQKRAERGDASCLVLVGVTRAGRVMRATLAVPLEAAAAAVPEAADEAEAQLMAELF